MAESRGGPSNPKFSDLVPSLKGESNWEIWKQYMEIALNGIDPSYWPLLIGQDKRPTNLPGMEDSEVEFEDAVTEIDDDTPAHPTAAFATQPTQPTTTKAAIAKRKKAQQAWDQKNAIVLSYVASSLDATMLLYFRGGNTAALVYEELRSLYEGKIFFSIRNKVTKWATWKYKAGTKPEEFVTEWRHLFTEMQVALPIEQRVSSLYAIYVFLHAVSNNTACQHWLNTVSIHDDWSYDKILHNIFGVFIASEGRRIRNDGQLQKQQASANIASADNNKKKKKKDNPKGEKEEDKQTKKQYCPFHKRETIHKPKDCFLNPKKKDKSESASMENLWC
ncbi:hypothetical protein N7489_002284 [Penicillium chrysogenum]|uniref:uncharacterized protein n=1 Tax=Penicillium chrysogenum TaxID=5076 RepID=UPI0024DF1938|nr:uncharacterized protein N7489_002284 [Penicillium chrysogenum]KAJ5251874.1 hypothetical protein N7489_002284 [Penicillium chrysogenum]